MITDVVLERTPKLLMTATFVSTINMYYWCQYFSTCGIHKKTVNFHSATAHCLKLRDVACTP